MAAPTIAGIGIGRVLKGVTSQRVEHLVLNRLNRGRKIRNEMVGVGIETNHDRVG